MEEKKSVFETLNSIDVTGKTEKKNGLTYLSWAWAWGEIKKKYPETTYKVYESTEGRNYFTDGRTCWVKCSVTCGGIENIEYLPVMDYRNMSIHADKVTSMDVNKAIQRCVTKAIARHGLGLYIYAGEDLPEEMTCQTQQRSQPDAKPQPTECITQEQYAVFHELFSNERIAKMCEIYHISGLEQLPATVAQQFIDKERARLAKDGAGN